MQFIRRFTRRLCFVSRAYRRWLVRCDEWHIKRIILRFFRLFEKLTYLDADIIVKDFSPSCKGREHQRRTIINHQKRWREEPFTLEVEKMGKLTIGHLEKQSASDIRIIAKFIEIRWSDNQKTETVCTHIYTVVKEDGRWWICNYKVEYLK